MAAVPQKTYKRGEDSLNYTSLSEPILEFLRQDEGVYELIGRIANQVETYARQNDLNAVDALLIYGHLVNEILFAEHALFLDLDMGGMVKP